MKDCPYKSTEKSFKEITCADPEGGQGVPLKNHKNIGFLSNTGPDPLTNYKATKPAFNVGISSARQRNAFNDGPLIVYLDPPSTLQLKDPKPVKFGPL